MTLDKEPVHSKRCSLLQLDVVGPSSHVTKKKMAFLISIKFKIIKHA